VRRSDGATAALVSAQRAARGTWSVASPIMRTRAWLVVMFLAGLVWALLAARRRRAARFARRERRDVHETRLEEAYAPTIEYEELADVVEKVAAFDDRATAELETLLDQYVEVMLQRSRCRTALDLGEPVRLERRLACAGECHPREAAVLARRVVESRRVAEHMNHLDDSLAEVAQLLRYYAERASLRHACCKAASQRGASHGLHDPRTPDLDRARTDISR